MLVCHIKFYSEFFFSSRIQVKQTPPMSQQQIQQQQHRQRSLVPHPYDNANDQRWKRDRPLVSHPYDNVLTKW